MKKRKEILEKEYVPSTGVLVFWSIGFYGMVFGRCWVITPCCSMFFWFWWGIGKGFPIQDLDSSAQLRSYLTRIKSEIHAIEQTLAREEQ